MHGIPCQCHFVSQNFLLVTFSLLLRPLRAIIVIADSTLDIATSILGFFVLNLVLFLFYYLVMKVGVVLGVWSVLILFSLVLVFRDRDSPTCGPDLHNYISVDGCFLLLHTETSYRLASMWNNYDETCGNQKPNGEAPIMIESSCLSATTVLPVVMYQYWVIGHSLEQLRWGCIKPIAKKKGFACIVIFGVCVYLFI